MADSTRNLALTELANSQYGVVSSSQLRAIGYSSATVALYRQPGYFRSAYERKLRRLLAAANIAMPSFNFFVESVELDAYWPKLRFAVEVDAYSTHGSRLAFERDRARDQRLRIAGIEVARITARQIDTHPDWVGSHLKERIHRREAELAAMNSLQTPPDVAVPTTP